jgi:tRNA uridine 5-carboxymethylaminomethyl modification enzyme
MNTKYDVGVKNKVYDVVVIGGGHAGIEASHAAWKLGAKTALMTMDKNAIGRMSCNPAIGGVAKGQIVRDIDALGGLMGKFTDKAGIQFRMLNNSKGPAVWGPRAQADMDLYSEYASQYLQELPGLDIIEDILDSYHYNNTYELIGKNGTKVHTKTLIITSGTFLAAKMYTGMNATIGGRVGEESADNLSRCLLDNKIALRRLKTGTPMRLDGDTIVFEDTEIQYGDTHPVPFSFSTDHALQNLATCWITRTTAQTHEILRSGFAESPLFKGVIQGIGPRYCPSIEDKVNRFADRDSHQLFLEPEGLHRNRIYVNGFSSSLPAAIQEKAMRTIPGLQNAKILQIGYAVEYDSIDATQLWPTMECKNHPGLYFAGQVNGTSGYEEAAGQGLMAGINAARKCQGLPEFLLSRSQSYIGVMLDDLVKIDLDEPYRMFTSRSEYRLFLRQDNAEDRLMHLGHEIGMIDNATWQKFCGIKEQISKVHHWLSQTKPTLAQSNAYIEQQSGAPAKERCSLLDILRRPESNLQSIVQAFSGEYATPDMQTTLGTLNAQSMLFIEAEELYRGFFERQKRDIERLRKMDKVRIPPTLAYENLSFLSTEARQKLQRIKPLTVSQAAEIPGVRQTDLSALMQYLDHS